MNRNERRRITGDTAKLSTLAFSTFLMLGVPPGLLATQDVASMEGDPPVSGGHSDADLEVEIEEALVQQTGVSRTGIDVEVRNGVATLSGTVDSEAARAVAVATAMKAGATGVENLLRIGEP